MPQSEELRSHGRDMRSKFKVHQFDRVAQLAFTVPHDDEREDDTAEDEPKLEDVGEDMNADKADRDVDKEDGDKKKKKLIVEKYSEDEELYNTRPIQIRTPHDISNLEHGKFYKSLTKKGKNYIKLYERRVFFMVNCEDLIPEYTDFLKGVVSREDLLFNISGETFQLNETLKVNKKNLLKIMELT